MTSYYNVSKKKADSLVTIIKRQYPEATIKIVVKNKRFVDVIVIA